MHKTVWNSTALAPVPQHEIPDTCNTPLAPCTPILSSPLPSPKHLPTSPPPPHPLTLTCNTGHLTCVRLCWRTDLLRSMSINSEFRPYIHVDQKVSSSKTQYTYRLQIHVSYEIGVTHQHEISCKLDTHKKLFSQHVHVEKLKSPSVELVAQKVASQED